MDRLILGLNQTRELWNTVSSSTCLKLRFYTDLANVMLKGKSQDAVLESHNAVANHGCSGSMPHPGNVLKAWRLIPDQAKRDRRIHHNKYHMLPNQL